MRIAFAPWEPDKADLDTGVSTIARNVIPGANCYLPVAGFSAVSGVSALAGNCLGGFLAQKSDGTFINFAAANDGTDDRIYTYGSGTWTDRSKSGGYGAADPGSGWRFAQYGSFVYAASGANNDIQVIDIDDLPSGFADVIGNGGTDPPRAKFISVIGEFLVLAGLTDYPNAVQWSGIGDAAEWRIGTLGCDIQEFPDGGLVTGITGAEYGLVFQENSIRRMVFSPGSPYVFEFQRLIESSGTSAGGAISRTNSRVFFLAEDGFWMEAGGQFSPIGAERVNRTFFADISAASVSAVQAYADPVSQRVYWAYPSSSQSDTSVKDKILCYHYILDRWTLIEQSVTYIGPVALEGISIDSAPLSTMALEDVPYSLDSPYWSGGRPVIGGFDSANKLGTFSGDALEATIETGLYRLNPAGRTQATAVEPLIDTDECRVNVATRRRISDSDFWRTERAPSLFSGLCRFEAQGRYHKFRLRVPAGTSWTKAQGLEFDGVATGAL